MALNMSRAMLQAEFDYDHSNADHVFEHRTNSGLSFNNRENPAIKVHKPFTVTVQTGNNLGKVRWLQDNATQLIPDPHATEHLISTTCGQLKSDITLWKLSIVQDEYGKFNSQVNSLCTVESPADVTDVVAVTDEVFAVTTSQGSLSLYKCPRNEDDTFNRIEHTSTKHLHNLRSGSFECPCPARAVATNFSSLVSVGEDGSIHQSTATTNENVRSLDHADPLSIYCVDFVSRSEILTGNGGGQLKRWDLREPENKPVQILNPNFAMNNIYGVISLAVHPSQKHLVIAGYQSGCMDLYDLRGGSRCDPIANLASNEGSLSELYFHQINPDHFFSCSSSGQVCQWYPGHGSFNMQDGLMYTPDVNIEFLKRGLIFKQLNTSLFPVNSMNVSKHDRLISGGDSGVLFCTEISAQ
ncbi:nucleoporin Nup43 isoform X2 [Folsomia candida]|uniref:nucleoporin Nup43 isoform X2 n=1 Tax=Folsomia candida TaxID=158441 RepID=UPI000B909FDA|nr:nucleoporin Nup43 isoform X2 [Folsomia candida]